MIEILFDTDYFLVYYTDKYSYYSFLDNAYKAYPLPEVETI
jgi:hypothetical protein